MILLFLAFICLFRLAYWYYYFSKFPKPGEVITSKEEVGVSIVICVKNGLAALKENLPSILTQKYSTFEVIIVDDFSKDGLEEYISNLNHPKIKFVKPQIDQPGKKIALETGVLASQNYTILVTDCDCQPASEFWISGMISAHTGNDITLGYSPFFREKTFLGTFSAFENWYTALQYFSYARKNMAYMGVGRNLMFERKLFMELNPYFDNYRLAGGDDDIFVSKANKAGATIGFCLHKNTWVYTPVKSSWKEYFRQKRRHISTSVYYSPTIKRYLLAFSELNMGMFLMFVIAVFFGKSIGALLILVVFYSLMHYLQKKAFAILETRSFKYSWPLLDLGFAIYLHIMAFMVIFTNYNSDRTW